VVEEERMSRIRSHSMWLWVAGGIGLLLLFPVIYPSLFFINTIIEVLINGLFGVSLNLLVGYTGLLSLGHCAFFAMGSYGTGILLQKLSTGVLMAIFSGLVLSGIVAFMMGYLSTRVTRFYFGFLTLAFSQIIFMIIVKWAALTGGFQGLTGGIPKPPIHFFKWFVDISPRFNFYYFTVVFVCGSFVLCKLIIDSPFGWVLRCIRDNPLRAQFIGINIRRYQIAIFTIAGMFGAVSGGLTALNINGCFPEHAEWIKGADPIFMILVGGMKNFAGPIVGAAVLVFLNTFVGWYTRFSTFFLGIILILLVVFARMGIVDFLALRKMTRHRT
jgi:branched-chain amino acid transport system permease protein